MTTIYELFNNELIKADFKNFNFSDFYFKQVLDIILRNTSVREFDFENSNLDDSKLQFLVRSLVLRNTPISELNLNNTNITLSAFASLKHLIKLIKIKKIIINNFDDESIDITKNDLCHIALVKRVLINFT